MKRSLRLVPLVLGGLLGVASLVPLSAAPAQAASGDRGYINSTEERDCPDTRCATLRYVSGSAPIICFRDAGSAYGTNRWFRIAYAGGTGWVSANRVSSQPSVPYCSDLLSGETLWAGQSIWSGNGQYNLAMGSDGNLVLYGPSSALWSSRTSGGGGGARLVQQGDGNLVVYNASNRPLWNTGTMVPGTSLAMQNDANVVEYGGPGALWATSWHRTQGQPASYNLAADSTQCTYWALEQWKGAMGFYPALSGDAGMWNDTGPRYGWLVIGQPATQAVVVFEPNVQGSGSVGHVGWVDALQTRADGLYIHITERNFAGRGVTSDRWVKHVAGMSYLPAYQL